MSRAAVATAFDLSQISNDGKKVIDTSQPYGIVAKVVGTAPILFHRWSVDGVETKSKAAKGSKAKKEDDLESYVYRDHEGNLAIPGRYFRGCIINAAKFRQDPRSPRKSAMDLFKAALIVTEEYCSLGVKTWDYVDKQRVTIQRNAITRCRPALDVGWKCEVALSILLPEYITPQDINEVLQNAGRLIGVADFRPTYGRFQVVSFEVF